jgi:hypothetical protein
MSQKAQVSLVDDIDGSEAAETVLFGLDGTHYEIDLNTAHAGALRTTLVRYTRAGRKVRNAARQAARTGSKVPGAGLDYAGIRAWARGQGLEVGERGRVPGAIVADYEQATRKMVRS